MSTFRRAAEPEGGDTLIHRDNTFGTPEEDAFRRDFTVNALFYDIANFSVIDWVGGLEDLDGPRHPHDRRPRGALPRGPGAHAARGGDRGAARLRDRRRHGRGRPPPAGRDRAQQLRPHPGGVLQDPAPGPLAPHLRDAARVRPPGLPPARGGPRDRRGRRVAPRLPRPPRRVPAGGSRHPRPADEPAPHGLAPGAARRPAAARGGLRPAPAPGRARRARRARGAPRRRGRRDRGARRSRGRGDDRTGRRRLRAPLAPLRPARPRAPAARPPRAAAPARGARAGLRAALGGREGLLRGGGALARDPRRRGRPRPGRAVAGGGARPGRAGRGPGAGGRRAPRGEGEEPRRRRRRRRRRRPPSKPAPAA